MYVINEAEREVTLKTMAEHATVNTNLHKLRLNKEHMYAEKGSQTGWQIKRTNKTEMYLQQK